MDYYPMSWVEKWFAPTPDWLMGTALEFAQIYCCDYLLLHLTVDQGTRVLVGSVLWSQEVECSRPTIIGINNCL